jgi:type VI secretion system secreted protein Hcp
MAQMNFLKLEQAEGESQVRGHENEIEVLSWNWSVRNVPAGISHGRGASKPTVSGVAFTHFVDSASPKLMKHCLGGTHLPKAILIVAREMDGPPLEYLRLSFDNVMITSVMLGAIEGSSNIVETATIEFTGFTEEYFQQSPTGSTGTGISVSYDIRTSQIT